MNNKILVIYLSECKLYSTNSRRQVLEFFVCRVGIWCSCFYKKMDCWYVMHSPMFSNAYIYLRNSLNCTVCTYTRVIPIYTRTGLGFAALFPYMTLCNALGFSKCNKHECSVRVLQILCLS